MVQKVDSLGTAHPAAWNSSWRKAVSNFALCATIAGWFGRSVARRPAHWEERCARDSKLRVIAAATFLLWIAIIFLGRFIAYDNVWGAWSPAAQQG